MSGGRQSSLDELSVAVVIPCRNAAHTIVGCLNSLVPLGSEITEVVVVDDGSDDDTANIALSLASTWSAPLLLLRLAESVGPARARNIGAASCSAELVLFLDSDVEMISDTVRPMLELMATGRFAGVTALYATVSRQPGVLAQFQSYYANWAFRNVDATNSPYYGTQCGLISRKLWEAVHGFDQNFREATVEDFDLGVRLRARGHALAVSTDTLVVHNHRYSGRDWLRNYFRKAAMLARIIRRYPSSDLVGTGYLQVRSALAAGCIVVGVAMSAWTLSGRWFAMAVGTILVVAGVAGWWDFLSGAGRAVGWSRAVVFGFLRLTVFGLGLMGAIAGVIVAVRDDSLHGDGLPRP